MPSFFLNKFSRFTPDEGEKSILENRIIDEIKIGRESKSIEVRVGFPDIIDHNKIFEIENKIREIYSLSYMRIIPRYPSDLFSIDNMKNIMLETQRKGVVSRGFFNDYKCRIENDRLIITIALGNGGIELLYTAETQQVISDIIFEEFSLRFDVDIESEESGNFDFNNYIRSREDTYMAEYSENIAPPDIASADQNESAEKPVLLKTSSVYEDNCLFNLEDNIISIGKWSFDISAPEIIFGEEFGIKPIPIRNIEKPMSNITIAGQVFVYSERPSRNIEKTSVSFGVSDGDSSIFVKMFLGSEELESIRKKIKKGVSIAVCGGAKKDKFDDEIFLNAKSIMKISRVYRMDNAEQKRVELHLHTNLSTMDALIKPEEIISVAHKMGHKAIAITDHGTLQAYPTAMIAAEDIKRSAPDGKGIKVIYGIEAYFVDDTARAVYGSADMPFTGQFIVFDIETTGLSAMNDKITEIGAVRLVDGKIQDTFLTYCDPETPIPEKITELTGITDEMVKGAPKTYEAVSAFLEFIGDDILIAHNANFDIGFIKKSCSDHRIPFNNPYIDTVAVSRYVNPDLQRHRLDTIAKYYNFEKFNHHRASDDAEMLAKIFIRMTERLNKEGVFTVNEMIRAMGERADPLKLRSNHMIILVKNQLGLKNLYKMVSESELKYFYKHPRIPKSLLENMRDGLIIGSACEAGELFTAVLEGKSDDDLKNIASFYDYLEIQPLSNNTFLLDNGRVKNIEELKEFNRRIVRLGEQLGKPVVATTDAHFLNEEDEVLRQILLHGQEYSDYGRKSGLFFKTTDEMLEEFSYLGREKAFEVVVKNTNLIADMIEEVRPIPKGTYTPKIEGSDEELQTVCYSTARSIYGDKLPEIVQKRLSKELDSIIEHGFSVLYIVARKLVKKSEELGYAVGSRGSVGSSFVATMAGISEVNPLPPHYVCPGCRHSEFITDSTFGSGFDLPDKNCPNCGMKMTSDGHDIPFETFLGFYGDKSPDIDLNFSGEVQAIAHKYTEELFGSENVFRAGTLSTLAEKTAYGYVMKYLETRGISPPKAEIERLKDNCVGVKRTTGQHPGGIIVVPDEYEVYDFTPIQHPPKDSSTVTTHFPFVYLHDTILKLDILGHDIPTKYKMFEKYSGVKIENIPMNDSQVYELFKSTRPLGVSEDEIGTRLGTFGLPEMGTRFIQQVLLDAKPKNFADLLQISGLTHGTDVWIGNAKDLIEKGICDISQVVGTRDGIMIDLIRYGVENKTAFDIMEDVRKGNKKGLIYQYEEELTAKYVPEWYISSCKKIKYMFPKAHAAAYVMSAIRLGWYKIYHPVAFYAGFFTVVPDGLDAEIITKDMSVINSIIKDLEAMGAKATQNEQKQLTALQLVRECRARGVKLLPVNFQKSDASDYIPEGANIRIPFSALPGLGENAAKKIIEARDVDRVTSIEDLQSCSRVSRSIIELLRKNGVLNGLPDTNQMTLF